MKGARDVALAGTDYRVEPSGVGANPVDLTEGWWGLFRDPDVDEIHLWDVYEGGAEHVLEVWLSVSMERGGGYVAPGSLTETITLRTPAGEDVLDVGEVASGGLLGWPTYGVSDHGADVPLATWRRNVPAFWNWTLRDGATGRDEARVAYEATATAITEALALGSQERATYAVTTPTGGRIASMEKRGGIVVHGALMRSMAIAVEGGAIPPEVLVALAVGLLRGRTMDAS